MRTYWLCFLGLLILLGSTVALSFAPLGKYSVVVSLAIACAKVFLIMYFFMQLKSAATVIRVTALTGFIWLAILLILSFSDYAFRETIVFFEHNKSTDNVSILLVNLEG